MLPTVTEEDRLIELARAGDPGADLQVISRADAGSLRCQRAILDALGQHYFAGAVTPEAYVTAAEKFARLAAASGEAADIRRLAALLDVKAYLRPSDGPLSVCVISQIECFRLLDGLCDQGDDEALQMLAFYAGTADPFALDCARHCRRNEAEPAGPKAPAPLTAEQVEDWLASLPPPTRLERAKWWLQDRWWDVRWFVGERVWDLKFLWWRLADRVAAMRGN